MSIIKTDKVSYSYTEQGPLKKAAINNISFSIEKGEILGIIGHTGSGKSTLVQTLNGLIKPLSGTVFVDGKELWVKNKKLCSNRFKVGLVFQYPEHQLFEETVYADIAFGPKNLGLDDEEIKQRVTKYLELLGLPLQYLDKSPFDLSGGEKRRVALAGILAMEPQVLVLDEPTAGLDPKGREMLFEAIKNYKEKQDATVIIVSHSMEDLAMLCSKLLVLHKGEMAMFGSVAEVFGSDKELNEMGLDVPAVTKVLLELKKMGLNVDTNTFTVKDAVSSILSAARKGEIKC